MGDKVDILCRKPRFQLVGDNILKPVEEFTVSKGDKADRIYILTEDISSIPEKDAPFDQLTYPNSFATGESGKVYKIQKDKNNKIEIEKLNFLEV